MRTIRWLCDTKEKDRFTCSELKERLGIGDMITVVWRHRLRCCGHVLRKDKNDLVKKCMDYEVGGVRPRGRPKKT